MKILTLLFIFTLSLSAFSQVPDISTLKIGKRSFSYFINKAIDQKDKAITRAIITVHGSVKNGDTYYKSVSRMAKKLNLKDSTIVLSPMFKESQDQRSSKEIYYRPWQDWWIGNDSIDGSRLSSFDVIDVLVKKLADKNTFPNLKTIVLTGHSAGGHLTQRYALGSRLEDKLVGVKLKYVVANPGTYAFLNKMRPVIGSFDQFQVPSVRCAYNDYKFGLKNRNRYMSKDTTKKMISRYLKRDVTYLLGEEDTGDVEQTCMAQVQGRNRFERGNYFKRHLDKYYPTNSHKLVTVPSVGHTQYGMYTSEVGSEVLFQD